MPEPAAIASNARILVINVARIGDTLMLTPSLRALKNAVVNELLSLAAPRPC